MKPGETFLLGELIRFGDVDNCFNGNADCLSGLLESFLSFGSTGCLLGDKDERFKFTDSFLYGEGDRLENGETLFGEILLGETLLGEILLGETLGLPSSAYSALLGFTLTGLCLVTTGNRERGDNDFLLGDKRLRGGDIELRKSRLRGDSLLGETDDLLICGDLTGENGGFVGDPDILVLTGEILLLGDSDACFR